MGPDSIEVVTSDDVVETLDSILEQLRVINIGLESSYPELSESIGEAADLIECVRDELDDEDEDEDEE